MSPSENASASIEVNSESLKDTASIEVKLTNDNSSNEDSTEDGAKEVVDSESAVEPSSDSTEKYQLKVTKVIKDNTSKEETKEVITKNNSDGKHYCDICNFSCFKEEFMKIHKLHKHNEQSSTDEDPLAKVVDASDDGSRIGRSKQKANVKQEVFVSNKEKEEVYINNIKS